MRGTLLFLGAVLSTALLGIAGAATLAQTPSGGTAARAQPSSETHEERGRIAAGGVRFWRIQLRAHECLRAVIDQKGAQLRISVATLDGAEVARQDAPIEPWGTRPVYFVAETPAVYLLEIQADSHSPAGEFVVKTFLSRRVSSRTREQVRREREGHQRFNAGIAFARSYQYMDAHTEFEAALSAFRTSGDRHAQGLALASLGAISYWESQQERAVLFYQQAFELAREVKDRTSQVAAMNEMARSWERVSLYDKSLLLAQQALAISQRLRYAAGEGEALQNLGIAYFGLSNYDKSIECLERSVMIAREIKDGSLEGAALNGLGWARDGMGQYQQAIPYYEQALEAGRDSGDLAVMAKASRYLGAAYHSLAEYDKAVDHYQTAIATYREIRDRGAEAMCLDDLGWTYVALSQYETALSYFQQARPILHEVRDRSGEADVLLNMGAAYQDLSRLEDAVTAHQQALAISRDVKDRMREGEALDDLGVAFASLGQFESAIEHFERALTIHREIKGRSDEAFTLGLLGSLYCRVGECEKGTAYTEQGLAIKRQLNDRAGQSDTLVDLGEEYARMGRPEQAVACFNRALSLAREIRYLAGAGTALRSLGDVSYTLGESEKAIRYYLEALGTSRAVRDRDNETAALRGLMETSRDLGLPRLAIFYGKQAVNVIQGIRSDIRGLSQDLQRSFLKGNEKPYHALAEILIAQGRLAEAEQVLALLKEDEYFEYVRRDASEASTLNRRADLTPDEAEYEKRYREVGDRLMAIGAERGELLGKKTLTPEQSQHLVQLEQDLIAGNQAFEHFLDDLKQHFSAKPEINDHLETLRETQGIMEDLRELPAGTVALFTLIGDDRLYTILRTPDAQKAYEFPIQAADLNRKILEFHQIVQHRELDPRPLAQELYKILLANMADDLRQAKAQTLMWSLDGALRYVPLAALYDGKHYLIEQYGVSVMTLASNTRLKDRPDTEWKAVGFGVTKAFEDAPALPSISSELRGIITTRPGDGGVLAGVIELDGEFTRQTMRQALLKRYPVVHIASHFHFQPGNDTKSFLLLGDGGHLTLAELKTSANLFGGVQLLTLSACNTAVGDGAEVEGFGTLAQRQGAKAVVASLWPVADASTSRLMQEFYRIRERSAGMTKLEALRHAQLELLRGEDHVEADAQQPDRGVSPNAAVPGTARFPIDKNVPYAHPYYWAPFFLMGNWL